MSKKQTIGLLLGSFNPVHNGHIKIAETILGLSLCEEVWFVISPQNPFKEESLLISEYHRLKMVELAISNNENLKVSTVEFDLPKPNFTYFTIQKLQNQYPDFEFRIIIGGDNWEQFDKWYNSEYLINNCNPIVYPRVDSEFLLYSKNEKVFFLEENLLPISSTEIREKIKNHQDIASFVSLIVQDYIIENQLYV